MSLRIVMPFSRSSGGGSFVSAALLAGSLVKQGFEVIALFPIEGSACKMFRQEGVEVRIVKLPVINPVSKSLLGVLGFLRSNLITSFLAFKYLREFRFDFVYCNDDTTVLPWGIAAFSQSSPLIWHVRSGRKGFLDVIRRRLSRYRIFISNFVKERMSEDVDGVVIYNPVDTKRFSKAMNKSFLRDTLGLNRNSFQMIQIGRDSSYKRPEWSIRTLQKFRSSGIDSSLIILGDFSEERRKALTSSLSDSDRDHVKFLGWVSNPEVWISSSDLLLHPAKAEHFGRIFIESSSCGVPFMASQTGAAPELVALGLPGFFFWDESTGNLNVTPEFIINRIKDVSFDVSQFGTLKVSRSVAEVLMSIKNNY